MREIIKNKKGIAALLVVLVITTSALIMAYNASWLGLGEIDLSYTAQKGGESLALAEACAEEALERIKKDANFGVGEGDITLLIGGNYCIINISQNVAERIIISRGILDNFEKKLEISVNVVGGDNKINLNYWREISD